MTNIIAARAVELAFDVPTHALMLARCPGKQPDTVLTIEQMVYTWRICEYVDPYSYERHWCYESIEGAVMGLARYLSDPEAVEPTGWKKAVTPVGVRRNGFMAAGGWLQAAGPEEKTPANSPKEEPQ